MMGCRSNYLAQNDREKETTEICGHLMFVGEKIGWHPSDSLVAISKEYYPSQSDTDLVTKTLCKLLDTFTPQDVERIIYDARSKESRALADWYEKHKEVDAQHEAEDIQAKKMMNLENGLCTI